MYMFQSHLKHWDLHKDHIDIQKVAGTVLGQ